MDIQAHWYQCKELQQAQNGKGKLKNNPASGANTTELPTGKLKPSTTDHPPQPSFLTLPPKLSNISLNLATTSKKPPSSTPEVVVDWGGKALDKAAKKGQNMLASHKSPTYPQTPDVKMTVEEKADNDDNYITGEGSLETTITSIYLEDIHLT